MDDYKREKVVRDGARMTSSRGKNDVLVRMKHENPVVCKLDRYLKTECLHKNVPPEGSKCHDCMGGGCAVMNYASAAGSDINFFPQHKTSLNLAYREAKRLDHIDRRTREINMKRNGGKI